jgi:hypothetical protein
LELVTTGVVVDVPAGLTERVGELRKAELEYCEFCTGRLRATVGCAKSDGAQRRIPQRLMTKWRRSAVNERFIMILISL